ncbi:hypothetical protein [Variovorax sp. EL159]|uniref:hypothetical protein n=1 Tax=Variovorax sp. EL159 TaxID=1566270 RepID=UPI00088A6052|nr:hypothetical protein [Variovorax sp. EL159]SCX55195.1 hypothetical protein SAMN03159363_1532 [Variovorax sp. EL159]
MDNGHIAAWRDHMPFDDISRRLLAGLAALAGIASLYALFWWAASATGFFLFDGYRNTWLGLGTALAFRDMDTVYYLLSWVFSVFGGLFGWAALTGFAFMHRRGWDAVPAWIKIGCAVGTAAGLAFEPGRLLALAPIVCGVALLLRSMLIPAGAGPSSSQGR